MKNIIGILLVFLHISAAMAQNQLFVVVKDAQNQSPLVGASLICMSVQNGTSTDANGLAILKNVPQGQQTIKASFVGYLTIMREIIVPQRDTLILFLENDKELLDEVVVSSTRSSRTIDDIPTRIETIAGEELEEKGNMNASNISMLLRESTGIQVQQTSATSANMNFRIQGLDGRYTQLLQNGMPLYSGFSSGLSIMQIPPLDLKRVEIIKGSSSTLYGGGAIAGMINLITKEPTDKRETLLQLTGASTGAMDINGFYSEKVSKKVGLTVFSSYHLQQPYDPNKDQFSDIPLQRRFNFNPRLFYYLSEKTQLSFGINTTFERREGGFVPQLLKESNPASTFVEANQSRRWATQFKLESQLGKNTQFFAKNSVSAFTRKITLPDYQFSGTQTASFTEIGIANYSSKTEWVGGINLWTDQFKEKTLQTTNLRDYNLTTVGAFIQNVMNATPKLTIETGLRLDYQNKYGAFLLPRISALYRFAESFSMRLGGGLGYKSPTVFIQESEQVSFRNVLPININTTKAETSQGLNLDFNFKTKIGEEIDFSINQLFFLTQLNNPLVLNRENLARNILSFENASGNLTTRGFETNVKVTYDDLKLFGFYSLIDTKRDYFNLNDAIPLTARHRAGAILMWEKEDSFRIGYEAYYTGSQQLNDKTFTRDYVTMGLMAEKKWEHFSIYANFENFLDVRQSRWQSMYSGTIQNPQFVQEIYAPTDGRVISLGLKIKL
jgi:outer membrane receptor for ferrienterochelin and colicins